MCACAATCPPARRSWQGLVEVERVLHVASGMLRRHVERLEIVVVVLDLRPLQDFEAETREDLLDLLPQHRERVPMAKPHRPAGERDVDRSGWSRAPNRAPRAAR